MLQKNIDYQLFSNGFLRILRALEFSIRFFLLYVFTCFNIHQKNSHSLDYVYDLLIMKRCHKISGSMFLFVFINSSLCQDQIYIKFNILNFSGISKIEKWLELRSYKTHASRQCYSKNLPCSKVYHTHPERKFGGNFSFQ